MSKIVLIDGHSILNRAFYGLPDLTNSEGLHTNAVYGFLNILFKILDEEKPQYLAVAFDVHAPTFRHEMYEAYKGTRKPMPEELREQVPVMKDVLRAMEIPVVEKAGLEADDILGTLARTCEEDGIEVRIISGDRDLLQLATKKTMIRIPKTKRGGTEIENYLEEDVKERYQVTPTEFIDVKALMGDSSDNIPGVPGIGEKTATKIITAYGSIERAHEHVEEINPKKARESLAEHYDMAVLSKTLATIKVDSDVDFQVEDARLGKLYTEEAYQFFKELEFKNLLGRFDCESPANSVEEHFEAVNDLTRAEEVFALAAARERIGFALLFEADEVIGLTLVTGNEEIYYLSAEGFLTGEYLTDKLKEVLKKTTEAAVLDLKPGLKFLEEADMGRMFDVGIGAYLLNPLKSDYPCEDIAKDFLGLMIPSRSDRFGKSSLRQAAEKQEEFLKYAGYLGYVAYKSAAVIEERLKEEGMLSLFREIEMPLVAALNDMERSGIRAKAEALKVYGEQLGKRIGELEGEIYELAGETFNINSPKQLGVVLFEHMGLKGGKKTKTGFSTAADVLEKLAPDYPVIQKILEYRQLTKLKSTYADGLAAYIGPDGRIHSTFNQTITATGRISSTEPNLQNIPIRMELGRLIRKVFVPEDGYVFVDADYSQIELRVLAHLSEDETLIQAYREAQDIHRLTASQVFHTPFSEVTPLQRRNAKAVNFGIVYGISSFGLSQDLSISRKEAGEYIKNYFGTYPRIKEFLDEQVKKAKEDGYVTTMYGRRRPVPELSSSNFMQRSFGERVAMNSPIQGTAADIIKLAMLRVNDRLKRERLKSRLILQVHDELLVEAHESEAEYVKELLTEEMRGAAKLSVPLEVDVHMGENWYEAK